MHLLENVMIGSLGAEGWNALWTEGADWSSPEVTAALENFSQALSYTNSDAAQLADWQPAAQLVTNGDAAFNIMGDWADGYFENPAPDGLGLTPHEDFDWAPVPGTGGIFVFPSDSFVLPANAPNPEATNTWLYGIPITTLIFRNYYAGIGTGTIEAARIDGASLFGIYRHIMLPLSAPSFAVVITWQFTQAWNEFLFAVLLTNQSNWPVTVALNNLAGSHIPCCFAHPTGLYFPGPLFPARVNGGCAQGIHTKNLVAIMVVIANRLL